MMGFRVLILLVWLLFCVTESQANHTLGQVLDITIDSAGQTNLRLQYYRDCDGVAFRANEQIRMRSQTCSIDTFFDLTFSGSQPVPNCFLDITTCDGGTLPGIELGFYTGSLPLPVGCNDLLFSSPPCCRGPVVEYYTELIVESELPNNAPKIEAVPIIYIFQNESFSWDPLVEEVDGDSLHFSLAPPLDEHNTPISYPPGYSYFYPLDLLDSLEVNPTTGMLSGFTANFQSVGSSAIMVSEYRNGQLLSISRIEFLLVVLDPALAGVVNTTVPIIDVLPVNNGPYQVKVGETVQLRVDVTESLTHDSLSIQFFDTSQLFSASINHISNTNKRVTISGTIPNDCSLEGRRFAFSISANDNNCLYPYIVSDTFIVKVDSNKTIFYPSVCKGRSYAGYSESGTYRDVYTAANGCDSIVVINLTVPSVNVRSKTITITQGDSLLINGMYQSTPGIYFDTSTTSSGCDSISRIDLQVVVGIQERSQNLNIYPNPSTGKLHITTSGVGINSIEVYDLYGRLLQTEKVANSPSTQVDISELQDGWYLIQVDSEKGRQVAKVLLMR